MKKTGTRIFVLILVLMIAVSGISSIGAFMREGGEYYYVPTISVAFGRQIEFLRILHNYTPGADSDAPNVVSITIPESEEGIFLIEVDETPTPEEVQFILEFTGIPYEKAEIFATSGN